MTTPTLPPNHELLTPEIAKLKPEGMKYAHNVSKVKEWRSFPQQWVIVGGDFVLYSFCAPLGTTAMLTTPVPEGKCVGCEPELHAKQHLLTCPAHPRNALIKVLPDFLAGLPEKPVGLMFASAIMGWKWTLDSEDWEKLKQYQLTGDYTYALPRYIYERIVAERKGPPGFFAVMTESGIIGTPQVSTAPSTSDPLTIFEVYHCPCCGELNSLSFECNDEYADEDLPERDVQYQIICDVHDAGCGMSSGFFHEAAKAVEAWNKRAPLNMAFTKTLLSTQLQKGGEACAIATELQQKLGSQGTQP